MTCSACAAKPMGRDYFGILPDGYYYHKHRRKSLTEVTNEWKASQAAALANGQQPAQLARGQSQRDYQQRGAAGVPGYSSTGVPYTGAAQQPVGPYNGPPGASRTL